MCQNLAVLVMFARVPPICMYPTKDTLEIILCLVVVTFLNPFSDSLLDYCIRSRKKKRMGDFVCCLGRACGNTILILYY